MTADVDRRMEKKEDRAGQTRAPARKEDWKKAAREKKRTSYSFTAHVQSTVLFTCNAAALRPAKAALPPPLSLSLSVSFSSPTDLRIYVCICKCTDGNQLAASVWGGCWAKSRPTQRKTQGASK